ncbi:MAG: AbrB/MazE/SpoVT family DNA-binding domain-containing protein [Infirmifilum sp.]
MAVVKVDERGRIVIPKEFNVRRTKVVIIPSGSFLVLIPLPTPPPEGAGGWLPSSRSRTELKKAAEEAAMRDAVARAKRRKQL